MRAQRTQCARTQAQYLTERYARQNIETHWEEVIQLGVTRFK